MDEQRSSGVKNILKFNFTTDAYALLHPCFEHKSAQALFQQVRYLVFYYD